MRFLTIVTCMIIAAASAAHAAERACCYEESKWYAAISGMAVLPHTTEFEESIPTFNASYELGTGVGFSGLVGYQFFRNASIELEFLGQSSSIDKMIGITPNGDKGNQTNRGIMLNHRWIYHNMGRLAPYIGAGIGMMQMDAGEHIITVGPNTETQDIEDTVIAYQFMAGLNLQVPNSKFEIYAGYRYIGTQQGEVKFGIIPGYMEKFDGDSHNIEIGGRLHF